MSETRMLLDEIRELKRRLQALETRQEHPGFAASDVARLSANNTFAGVQTIPNTGLHLLDTNASHDLIIAPGSDLSADRTFTVTTGDANRTLALSGNLTIGGTSTVNGSLVGSMTGGGTIATGGFTLTVPATGTAALLGASNTFTGAIQTIASAAQFTPQIVLNNSGGVLANGKGGIYFQSGGVGKWAIYHAPSDYFQILDGSTRSMEIRPTTRHLLLNTATDSGQLSIVTDATTSIGLVINTPASPTANIAEFRNNGTAKFTVGPNGSVTITEQTTPSAPAANEVTIYAVDNGSGKTQLMALFSSGAAQQLAIQP